MPRGYRHLNFSFAGGELSPEMWSRYDDARFQSGAARMRNMISHPRGSVARRPGFEMVREIKDSTREARLLPFRFSTDQTHAIEMGRATVDGDDTGYFRFHTNGGTLLQLLPDTYRAPHTATGLASGTNIWSIGTHDFVTGDPVVLTMEPSTAAVTFLATTSRVVRTLHGFANGDAVLFRAGSGSLPPEIVPGQIYFVRDKTNDDFKLTLRRDGQAVKLTTDGAPTNHVACLPDAIPHGSSSVPAPIVVDVNTTYYIIRHSGTQVKLAMTKADADAGYEMNFIGQGTSAFNDIRFHYDYRNGSVTFDTVAGSPFYCRKTPWGTPGALQVNLNDHLEASHGVTDPVYWVRQPGSSSTVTFTLGTDRVDWTAHLLSDGDPVTFSTDGTLPTEIVAGTVYYVRNSTANDFQIAASVPGPVVTLSGAPSGTNTAFANGIYEVPHTYAEEMLFEVNIAQSADVVTLTHIDKPAAELRRLGATHWVLADVEFNSTVVAPTGADVEPTPSQGETVIGVTAATPANLTTANDHSFAVSELVRITDVGDIPDGRYVVRGTAANKVTLKGFESGQDITSGTTTFLPTSRIRAAGLFEDDESAYVVTARDDNNEESAASNEATTDNDMNSPGAFNTISWDPVAGAQRYRIYKKTNGLFGFIGETESSETSFKDDNILPDLSVTPPILDGAVRKTSAVTFNLARNGVVWTDHDLEAGAPVVFSTDQTFPTGIDHDTTYYVLEPSQNEFLLSATPTGTTEEPLTGSPAGLHSAVSGVFPAAVVYFEQRRVFGGARLRPQDVRLTASSTESDLSYSLPTQDSDRIHIRLAARERSSIRHAVSAGHLLLLTSAAEFRLTPLVDNNALAPGSVSARAPTHVGVSVVAPVVVNNTVLLPADRGGHLREMGFVDSVGDYVTGDVSLRAAHLFDGRTIVQMAYHQAPHPIVWAVSSAGTLLGFSYIPEEQSAGWHEHDIGSSSDTVESCTAIAEDAEDRLYVITNRGGSRYVERMGKQTIDAIEDTFFVDWGVSYDGAAVSSLFLPHLTGLAVVYLADGVTGTGTVSLAGTLTLTTAASKIHVGLTYTSELRTLPLGMQLDAALGSGRTKNINQVWVRVVDSGAFDVGAELTSLVDSPTPVSGQLLTELVPVTIRGAWNAEGQVYVQQDDPLPLIVVALTMEVASGG